MSEIISKYVNNSGSINKKEYEDLYQESIIDNDNFWSKQGRRIDWIKPFTKIKKFQYSKKNVD